MRHHLETLKLGFPIAIGQLGTIVLTFADTMMVGRYGTPELGAASFVNSVFNLATMIILGYSYGITPLIATHYGRGEHAAAGASLRLGLRANTLFGTAVLAIFGALYFFLEHLGQPQHLLPLIRPYYAIIWVSMWFVMIFSVVRQFTDAITHTHTAMWILLMGNVINILLNALLIFGIGTFPELGLLGAGVATLVSRVLMAIAICGIVFASKGYAHFRQRPTQPTFSILDIHNKSWPVSSQLGFETLAFTGAAVMAGWIGEIPLAAYQVLISLSTLGFTLYYSFASGMSIRIAHFLSQNDVAQAHAAAQAGRNILLSNAAISSLVFGVGGATLIGLFTTDKQVVTAAVALLPALILYQFADAMQVCYANALRATGNVYPMTGIAFVAYFCIGLPLSYAFAFPAGGGLQGIYLSFTCCLLTAAILFYRFYRKSLPKKRNN